MMGVIGVGTLVALALTSGAKKQGLIGPPRERKDLLEAFDKSHKG